MDADLVGKGIIGADPGNDEDEGMEDLNGENSVAIASFICEKVFARMH